MAHNDEARDALRAALRAQQDEWTPACLEPGETIDLSRQGAKHPDAERLLGHLADCAYCRRNLSETQAAMQLAAAVRRWEATRTGAQAGRGAAPVVALRDGGTRVTLDAGGRLGGLDTLPEALKRLVTAALTNPGGVVPRPVTRQFASPVAALLRPVDNLALVDNLTLLEPVDSLALLRPVDTAVLGARPAFAWRPHPDATGYRVIVFADGKDVLSSPLLTAPGWQPSEPLAPGLYAWQVAALTPQDEVVAPRPPAPEALFEVLAPQKANTVRRAQERHADSPLTLGVLYVQAGLLDEAEATFEVLLGQNPESPVARELLRRVRQVRRPASAQGTPDDTVAASSGA